MSKAGNGIVTVSKEEEKRMFTEMIEGHMVSDLRATDL